jgi:hypothetical protein
LKSKRTGWSVAVLGAGERAFAGKEEKNRARYESASAETSAGFHSTRHTARLSSIYFAAAARISLHERKLPEFELFRRSLTSFIFLFNREPQFFSKTRTGVSTRMSLIVSASASLAPSLRLGRCRRTTSRAMHPRLICVCECVSECVCVHVCVRASVRPGLRPLRGRDEVLLREREILTPNFTLLLFPYNLLLQLLSPSRSSVFY